MERETCFQKLSEPFSRLAESLHPGPIQCPSCNFEYETALTEAIAIGDRLEASQSYRYGSLTGDSNVTVAAASEAAASEAAALEALS